MAYRHRRTTAEQHLQRSTGSVPATMCSRLSWFKNLWGRWTGSGPGIVKTASLQHGNGRTHHLLLTA
eukprot:CAMPEP_0172525356 /NCGR_PEP_ID=MMETSP1067-20121228/376_1 /TAXON_ID=265564 ORGANISM="Thalassiosira punctigera, Strain Tpunct2005C2" /NCGR_SAMPLE_ID=MMETSP1067 /ASSEMBLY_ACC=CAM_ASM_000444 /LENGTH=66 /DNA_ID=CAMNT_0013308583 /DNA_START=36 /DNA_END=233 /DNA_ORIENTATION=+